MLYKEHLLVLILNQLHSIKLDRYNNNILLLYDVQ